MLVLTRKENESICIGDNIRITVVGIRNGKVRIGVESPPEVHIMRSELLPKIKFDLRAQRQPLAARDPARPAE